MDAANSLAAPNPLAPAAPSAPPAVNHPAFAAEPQQDMQALMAQIIEIQSPPEVGLWPLAPGWWVLLVALTLAGSWSTWALLRWIKRRAYRRSGLRLLKRLQQQNGLGGGALARQLNEILKRTALASPHYRHLHIGSVHGAAWQAFLCQSTPDFPNKTELAAALAQAHYRPKAPLDTGASLQFCEFWLRKHQPLPDTQNQNQNPAPREAARV
jgi:hypothetical protein